MVFHPFLVFNILFVLVTCKDFTNEKSTDFFAVVFDGRAMAKAVTWVT